MLTYYTQIKGNQGKRVHLFYDFCDKWKSFKSLFLSMKFKDEAKEYLFYLCICYTST